MFFTGIIPGLVALFVRFRMNESEVWLANAKKKENKNHHLKNSCQVKKEEEIHFFFNSNDRLDVCILHIHRILSNIFTKLCGN